ncbi:MAG: SAM-dependent methyltransferase [Chloroflexi bacterium]|nr:SAM-dependent methyltransferase [Chloroflexota bacterium]
MNKVQASTPALERLLALSLQQRDNPLDLQAACRLFNGFSEGLPALAVDRYADTLVIHDFSKNAVFPNDLIETIITTMRKFKQPFHSVLLKQRFSPELERHRGTLIMGETCADQVREGNTFHAIDLRLNRDCSLYLDSAGLRQWLMDHSAEKTVLNTFAYTGSYGTAALAGGAKQVVQTDLNANFFQLFERSLELNGFPAEKSRFIAGDFFRVSSALRRERCLFDLVILDPPFFSKTNSGVVDQLARGFALVNKIRPLVADGGKIVFVNNALFLSGREFMQQIEQFLADDYLTIGERIDVPESFFGRTAAAVYPADPAPFNHPTKIILLEITRKDGRKR